MARLLSLVAVLLVGVSLRAADPPTIADLVKQLGDPKFAVREAAQKELLRRGEGSAPELEKLAKGADAETVERIGKVLYALVGYKDDIRRLIADVHEGLDSSPLPISDQLRGLIAGHQPGAGNLLLDILADPKHKLRRQTIRTFVSTWDVATPDQIDAYVRQSVTLDFRHRPKFPARVGARISVDVSLREGWTGWPQPDPTGFTFRTRTTPYVDGRPHDKPFDYRYPFGTLGWYRVGELAEGRHTIHAVMAYEFTHRGQKRSGEVRSKDSTFEVVSADTPDDLAAPKSDALAAKVRAALVVKENRDRALEAGYKMPVLPESALNWRPHVTWTDGGDRWYGLTCPCWQLNGPLDVDLCFEAAIHDLATGTVYPADPVVAPRGDSAWGHVVPRDARQFAKGRDGFVRVKVVLTPSRAVALTDLRITRYCPEPITSGELRMKVIPPGPPAPPPK